MSFEALFQAEALRAQQEGERRRAAHVAELRASRVEHVGPAAPHGAPPARARARALPREWLQLLRRLHRSHRHTTPDRARVA